MFENIISFFKNIGKKEEKKQSQENSKNAAKERLHLVLMQDRANVSADFLELMKQEIIDVIKKYIEIDENEIDVRLTNKENEDGTNGAPALYANIPILNIKNETRKITPKDIEIKQEQNKKEQNEPKLNEEKEIKSEEISQEDKVEKETKEESNDTEKSKKDNPKKEENSTIVNEKTDKEESKKEEREKTLEVQAQESK